MLLNPGFPMTFFVPKYCFTIMFVIPCGQFPHPDILFSPLFSLETELSFLSKNPYRTRKTATDSERQFGNLAKTFGQKIKHPIFHSNRYLLCQRPYICHFTPRLNVEVYSGVRNRRPPRQLIFQKFSTQDILIPTPPEIKF